MLTATVNTMVAASSQTVPGTVRGRRRAGRGEFRVHDLGDPISWLPDASVDLALCALAIEYVDDRVAALNREPGFLAFRLRPVR